MAEFLTVTRYDSKGDQMLVVDDYNSKAYSARATIISPGLLAKFMVSKNRYRNDYTPVYDIIHIPTGLVIARATNEHIKTIKDSFIAERWTLRDDTTFVMIPAAPSKYQKTYNHKPMSWEINCLIRYTLEKVEDDKTED